MKKWFPLYFECWSIKHQYHRYSTLGDFFMSQGKMIILASRMSHVGYTLAIIIHEMVEFVLCRMHGIKEEDVTKFDVEFKTGRCAGEPGDDVGCIYRIEHQAATHVERAVIAAFSLSWEKYEKECNEVLK